MFKSLIMLSGLCALAIARPGYLESAPLLYSPHAATFYHEPSYAKVGAIVKSYPTAVSHQSHSIVHSSAHVIEPIVAPIVKTTAYTAPLLHHATPILKTYSPYSPYADGFHHSAWSGIGPSLGYSSGWDAAW